MLVLCRRFSEYDDESEGNKNGFLAALFLHASNSYEILTKPFAFPVEKSYR